MQPHQQHAVGRRHTAITSTTTPRRPRPTTRPPGSGAPTPAASRSWAHAITYLSGSLIVAGILGALLGTLIHHRGRLRPEVGAIIAAIAAGPIGGGLGVILGHPKTGLTAAVGFVAATFAIAFRWDQADRRAGKDRRRRAEDRLGFLGLWRARKIAKTIGTAWPRRRRGHHRPRADADRQAGARLDVRAATRACSARRDRASPPPSPRCWSSTSAAGTSTTTAR